MPLWFTCTLVIVFVSGGEANPLGPVHCKGAVEGLTTAFKIKVFPAQNIFVVEFVEIEVIVGDGATTRLTVAVVEQL